jgi:hypothetical protein
MSVDLSVLDPLRMDHRLVWAPTSTTYESWVAAGKPCLRQTCGHERGNHIPSEGMECSECDCLGFVDSLILTIRGRYPPSKPEISENGAVAHSLMHI